MQHTYDADALGGHFVTELQNLVDRLEISLGYGYLREHTSRILLLL